MSRKPLSHIIVRRFTVLYFNVTLFSFFWLILFCHFDKYCLLVKCSDPLCPKNKLPGTQARLHTPFYWRIKFNMWLCGWCVAVSKPQMKSHF